MPRQVQMDQKPVQQRVGGALRPQPMTQQPGGQQQFASSQQTAPRGAPLPMKKPVMPQPSSGPQGGQTGGFNTFNPAEMKAQPIQQPAQPTRPQHNAIRPGPMTAPAPQTAPQVKGPGIKQPPMPMMGNPNQPRPAAQAPPMRQPQKFAAPPMPSQQPMMQQQMPQQQISAPPMAPPKGSGGPKPMTAGLAPPQRGPQSSASAGAPAVDTAQLSQQFTNIFSHYASLETNPKLRGETEAKFLVMIERMSAGQLAPLTLSKLSAIVEAIEANNSQVSSQAFRDLTQKCWPDVKDFSNALKALSTFRQKYGQ